MEWESYNCVLCHLDTEETLLHICSFSAFLPWPVGIFWDWLLPFQMICLRLFQPSGYIFNSFFLWGSGCQEWQYFQRHSTLFGFLQLQVFTFRKELALVMLKARNKYQHKLDQWLKPFVNFVFIFLLFHKFPARTFTLFI